MWMLALLLAPLATAQDWSEESCPTTGSAQFKYVRGEATGKTEAEALSAALDAALARAKPDVCEGSVESPRCAARMAHVVQYGGDTDTQGGKVQACRSVAIDWDKLNPLNEVVDTWLTDLDTLAAGAKATVGDNTTLYIEGPYGPGDCTLGGWSTHLERRVAAGLGLVSDAPKDSAGVLRLRITESGSEAVLSADVRRPDWDSDTFKALEPVTWPSDLFLAGHHGLCEGPSQDGIGAGSPVEPEECGRCDGVVFGDYDRSDAVALRKLILKMNGNGHSPGCGRAAWKDAGLGGPTGRTRGPRCPELMVAPASDLEPYWVGYEYALETGAWEPVRGVSARGSLSVPGCSWIPSLDEPPEYNALEFQPLREGRPDPSRRDEPRCASGKAELQLCKTSCAQTNVCFLPGQPSWSDHLAKGEIAGGLYWSDRPLAYHCVEE